MKYFYLNFICFVKTLFKWNGFTRNHIISITLNLMFKWKETITEK